ncbi:class I SAM-dependent methyltransferase [Tumidithrix helvetica]|uniref:class I SAM-dependent methyltransferase n=1 Tax=Tumidithrix helvetica TaxID=3457545 RepID=UPI003CC587AD
MPLDKNLIEIIKEYKNHFFLINPSGQNVYLYLTYFVKNLIEYHFSGNSYLKILDWGCGKGHVTYFLHKLGFLVTSCDVLSGSEDWQSNPIIASSCFSVDELSHPFKLPYDDNSMDVVLSVGVLEHVPNDIESLKEINRILKNDGLFICFNLPYVFSWTQRLAHLRGDFYHDRLYSKRLVYDLARNSNFEILDFWHRQLLPKNYISYPFYRFFESLDQLLVNWTPLKYLATNIEFVAKKIN